MNRRIIFLWIVLSLIATNPIIAYAQSPEVTNGLTYLTSTQNPDGSWGDAASNTGVLPATVSVLEAMQALGETSSPNYTNAISWLQSQNLETTDYLSERIHTLSVSGTDQDTLLLYLDELITGAWGGYNDFESNNLDTAFAILALNKLNHPDIDTIGYAFNYLIDSQNTDGGFGFYPGDESNVYITSLVLKAFTSYNGIFDFQSEINSTATYLLSKQNADGGFSTGTSTVYETALSLIALIESGQGTALPLQNAINYLYATQLPNGSWNDDPYSTALALQALANVKPNLTISFSDISFSKLVPAVGETITITANIKNTGLAQADNVVVQFFDGDPAAGGILIGETTIPSIAANGSSQTSISWTVTTASAHTVFVQIDPLNSIDEVNENDNTANGNIYAGSDPNLTVSKITLLPAITIAGDSATVLFTVNNNGEIPTNNVLVEYYQAEDTIGGINPGNHSPGQYVKIGEIVIPEILPGANYSVEITKTFSVGWHNIKVIVDPLNTVAEINESDNEIDAWITTVFDKVDLILNSNIIVLPKSPKENDDIKVLANVYNYGAVTANAVVVDLYDGNPSSGGTKISEQIIDMIPLEFKQLEFHINLLRGSHDLYMIIDTVNAVIEYDESNNQATKSITVGLPSDVDFSITSSDIVFTPSSALPGDNITIIATVHNLGPKTDTSSVSIYAGNPSYGGIKLKEEFVVIPGNGTAIVTTNYTVTEKPTNIVVLLDENDLVYEKSEENNRANKKLVINLPDLVIRDKDIKINRMTDGSIYVSPLIRNLGGIDAANVSVSIYNGNPSSGGTLIASQLIDLIPSGSGKRINIHYSLNPGRNNLYVLADPDNLIGEVTEANNSAMKVVYKTDPNGADIAVTAIDASSITTDTQALTVEGTLNVTVENKSTVSVTTPFALTAYEDMNNNAIYDSDIDNKLGEIAINDGLNASAVNNYSIYINGHVKFRDNHIHVMADSSDVIIEKNEDNNDRHHKEDCASDPVNSFDVIEKWTWRGSDFEPTKNQVRMSPLVANMNDDNGDGIIDEDDIPDIIFISAGPPASDWNHGVLRVISGKDNKEIVSVTHPDGIASIITGLAVGDIDNNGDPEIIVPLYNDRVLIAYNHDGTVLWTSETVPYPYIGGFSPMVADLNNDGNPEIYKGRVLFDNMGKILWRKTSLNQALNPIAVDLDNNDKMEIVASAYAYKNDGSTYWFNGFIASASGFNAIGNFDGDIYPEVVYSGTERVDVLEHDGAIKWTFRDIVNFRYELQSAPAVGDVDGDGNPEIAVAGHYKFTVFNSDGTLRWAVPMYDATGGSITPIFFDLNGDRKSEIAVNDGRNFFVFNGDTGSILFSTPNPAGTFYEVPAVADIDNDGHAELIVFGGQHAYNDPYYGGIRVFEDRNGNWINSRRIWNQHSYHVTNIDEDGYIPLREEESWNKYNCYRCNVPIKNALDAPDLTASKIIIDQSAYPEYVIITSRIGNAGTLGVNEGATVSVYNSEPSSGGVLIGSASISRRLNPGEYEDVSVAWYYPVDGTYNIYAVADFDGQVKECSEVNNTASTQITLGSVATPDLAISASDVSINPSVAIEGQPAILSATVHNVGDIAVSNAVISFYDGDPVNGGTLIGSVTKPTIDAGTNILAEIPWNTMGQRGINFIHMVADPQNLILESNENNNSTLIQVDVLPPAKPDLKITSGDIVFSSQSPKEGDPLTLTTTIRNLGLPAGNVKVDLYDGDPGAGGVLLASYTIAPIVPFGGQEQVTFSIDTIGFPGSHDFYVIVDPDNTIVEQNENNNSVSANLVINSIGLNVGAAVNKPQYIENEDALITVNITDLQDELRELSANVKILDPSGVVMAALASQSVTVNPLGTSSASFIWNTGNTLTGSYSAQATVYDINSNPLARQSVQFGITSSKGVSANVVVDKTSYYPNEAVRITSTILNESANRIYENLTASVSITDTSGNLLFTDSKSVSALTPSSWYSFNSFWSTSVNLPGDYTLTLEAKDASGAVLSSKTASLTISGETRPSKLLRGQISVDRQSLLQGEPVAITYSVTNTGNVDLSAINLSILTVHVVELSVYDTLTDQTSLLKAQTYTSSQTLNTNNYTAKDYLVILRANIAGVEETLAGTYFRAEGAPSASSLYSPQNGVDVETLTPVLTVNNASDPNDDDLTYQFEIYSDSNISELVSSSQMITEEINTTSWQLPLELQENQIYYWRSRAYDGILYGEWMYPASFRVNVMNDPPTAPTLSGPADYSEVDTLTPVLTVNNASDPDNNNLTYNYEIALDETFTQAVSAALGIFEGIGTTSWQVPVTLTENTWYFWRAQADDWFIEGPWMTTASFFINTANDAPTAPYIVNPLEGSELTELYADITLSNSIDPDSAQLTYIFETDTVDTFDSAGLIRSTGIPEGQGTTSWRAEGLSDNTYYYVRAKASDGLAESSWSASVRFFINTANDAPAAPTLANPSNGSGVNAFSPTLSVHNSSDMDGDVLIYDLEVYADASMTIPVTSGTGITETPLITSWTVPVSLTENRTYYWRARAYDGELYSNWMPSGSFMINTANDAPGAPLLNSPADGSSLDTLYPTLSIHNAVDPDSDTLSYDIEIYSGSILVKSINGIPQNASGITSIALTDALSDNTIYTWRARAYDGDRYGAWMDMATFSTHLPAANITGTIDFDPNTLNKKSNGKWVVVYIELPAGYNIVDISISSILLNGTIPAEPWPYSIGDNDKDGIPDLMVKFNRNSVINMLPNGDNIRVEVTGTVGTTTFEGFDIIRVIP
jgi:subtilase family serine protease